jgi:hypothetical protein
MSISTLRAYRFNTIPEINQWLQDIERELAVRRESRRATSDAQRDASGSLAEFITQLFTNRKCMTSAKVGELLVRVDRRVRSWGRHDVELSMVSRLEAERDLLEGFKRLIFVCCMSSSLLSRLPYDLQNRVMNMAYGAEILREKPLPSGL